ncbi:hypothetical protein ACFE04_001662 [Oxalis oulophora]
MDHFIQKYLQINWWNNHSISRKEKTHALIERTRTKSRRTEDWPTITTFTVGPNRRKTWQKRTDGVVVEVGDRLGCPALRTVGGCRLKLNLSRRKRSEESRGDDHSKSWPTKNRKRGQRTGAKDFYFIF